MITTDAVDPHHFTLTVGEVADHLRLSERSVYNLLKAGEIESFKIGRSRRITRQALDAYIGRIAKGAA